VAEKSPRPKPKTGAFKSGDLKDAAPVPTLIMDISALQTALGTPPKIAPEPPKKDVRAAQSAAAIAKPTAPPVEMDEPLARTIADSEPLRRDPPKAPAVQPAAKPPVPANVVAKGPVAAAPVPASRRRAQAARRCSSAAARCSATESSAAAAPKAPAGPHNVAEEEEMKLRIPLQPGEPLSMDEMKHLEILEGIPRGRAEVALCGIVRANSARRHHLQARRIRVDRVYVLSGKAEIYTITPDKAALGTLKKKKAQTVPAASWNACASGCRGARKARANQVRHAAGYRKRSKSHLPPDMRKAEIGPGDLFGEMSCINFYPRSTNVRAMEDCVMLEIIRTVLDTIRTRKGKYKEKLEKIIANARSNSISTAFRCSRISIRNSSISCARKSSCRISSRVKSSSIKATFLTRFTWCGAAASRSRRLSPAANSC